MGLAVRRSIAASAMSASTAEIPGAQGQAAAVGRALTVDACAGVEGVGWNSRKVAPPARATLLAAAVRRQVLFRSLRCIVDGVHLVVGRHMRLIHRRQNVFHLVKLGCFAMVPCCVLMMFSRTFMKFAQR